MQQLIPYTVLAIIGITIFSLMLRFGSKATVCICPKCGKAMVDNGYIASRI